MLNRKLANNFFFINFNTSLNSEVHQNMNIDMNMETDILRGWSTVSSINNFRELSVHSSISSISYAEKIEVQSINPSWTDQVELTK